MSAPTAPELPSEGRDQRVDVLRGLALCGVIAIHLCARIPAADPLYAAGRFVDHLGRFGVPLFLGVFGWGLGRAASRAPIGPAWVFGRLRAVVPAYLAWALLYAAVAPLDGGGSSLWDPRVAWPARFGLTLFGYGAEQLYYMTAYFGLLLIGPLAGTVLASVSGRTALALATAGLVANAALLGHVQSVVATGLPPTGVAQFLLHTEARTPLHWFGFFLAGAGLGRYLAAGSHLPQPRWWWLPLGLSLHTVVALRPPSLQFDDFWASPALVWAALAFLAWGTAAANRLAPHAVGRWLGRFGADSLPTYLGHVLWLRLGWWATADWPTVPRLVVALGSVVAGNWAYGRVHPRIFTRRSAVVTSQ